MSERDSTLSKIAKLRGMTMATVTMNDVTIKAPYLKSERRAYNPYDDWADAGQLLDEITMAAATTSQVTIKHMDTGRYNVKFVIADGRHINEHADSLSAAVCKAWIAWRERPYVSSHPIFIPGV